MTPAYDSDPGSGVCHIGMGPMLCYQPVTAQYCDQEPIGTQLSSSPGVTFLYQCGIITGCPHPCYNMTVGVLTRGAHRWSSSIRLLTLECL